MGHPSVGVVPAIHKTTSTAMAADRSVRPYTGWVPGGPSPQKHRATQEFLRKAVLWKILSSPLSGTIRANLLIRWEK